MTCAELEMGSSSAAPWKMRLGCYPVIAPLLAGDTSRAYFASAPVV